MLIEPLLRRSKAVSKEVTNVEVLENSNPFTPFLRLWVKPGIPGNSAAREIRRYCMICSKLIVTYSSRDPDL